MMELKNICDEFSPFHKHKKGHQHQQKIVSYLYLYGLEIKSKCSYMQKLECM
jgi:hypothetical protein